MQPYAEQQRRTLIISIALFLLLAATIVFVGYRSYRNFEAQSRVEAEVWLSTVSNAKLSGLGNWRDNLLNYANFIYQNQAFSDSVAEYFDNPQNINARGRVLDWLDAYKKNSEFNGVFLLDKQGNINLSTPANIFDLDAAVLEKIPQSATSGEIIFVDFYRSKLDKQVYLAVLVPVIEQKQVIGFLLLRVDPTMRLYPLLAQQVTQGMQAQSFLVRYEKNKATLLSPLKFMPDAALNLRLTAGESENLAAKAVLGNTGIIEGVDYRDVAMLADIQPVPDSSWILVTHTEMVSVYAPVNENFGRTVIVTGTIILYLGLGAVLIWRQRQLNYYQSEAEAAEILRKTKEELLILTRELDDKVRERTAELQDVNQQLRALSQQMVDMQEQQIKSLARELHDSIGQNLTAININLSVALQLLPKKSSEKIRARLTDTSHLVEETVARMRNVIADFLPPMLERYGLSPALSWYGEQFAARTNIGVQVNDRRKDAARFSPEVEIGLFRIIQEAMNNIAKHSHASLVVIEIRDEENMTLTISDNGIGFEPQVVFAKPAHWGFAIMRERARALDADLDIQSASGKGVTITLRILK